MGINHSFKDALRKFPTLKLCFPNSFDGPVTFIMHVSGAVPVAKKAYITTFSSGMLHDVVAKCCFTHHVTR